MKKPFLEVTYRGGKPFAAYLYLDRRPGDRVARTERRDTFAVDYTADYRPIGVEFVEAKTVSLTALNTLLEVLQQVKLSPTDMAPLVAA